MKFQGWYLCPVMSGEKGEDVNGIPRLKTDLKSPKKEEVDVVTTSTEAVSTGTAPQTSLVHEYTVNVPLVRPKPEFLQILQTVGATGEVFTKKEICFFLKEYIGSRLLYDPNDPRIVHCQSDPLGKVFGLGSFTINDVFELLAKHCSPMPDSCIKRRRHILSPSTQHQHRQLLYRAQQASQPDCFHTGIPSSVALSISVRSQSPITSTTPPETVFTTSNTSASTETSAAPKPQSTSRAGRKRSRGKSSSESEGRSTKRKASVSFQNEADTSGYPWYFTVKVETSDESEVLSVQGKETVKVKDSSDDLWFVEEDQISVHIDTDDTFSVEYEVESDRDSDVVSVNSDASSNTTEDLLVVCGDSDVEFWADSSSSESDEELTDADKWKCGECDNLNTPVQRFCGRCWKLRPGWLPEFPHRKPFRRSFSAPNGLSSSESEGGPRRKRSKQRSSRSSRQTSNFAEFSRPYASYHHTSTSSSSPLQQNLSKESSHTSLISDNENSELNGMTPAGLSRYDSGIGMGPTCSSSQSSQKSSHINTFSSKQPLSVEGDDAMEVRTTLSNYRSTLSEQFKDLCMICLSKPKNSCIIHGKTSHQVCCYGCAKTLKKRGRTCPVCRRPIKHVTKNYLM